MDTVVDFAGPEDDAGIRELVRQHALPGRVRLAFPREPDFSIGCAVTGDTYRIVVARAPESGEVVGVACRSTRRVFLNGAEHRVGYLGQLRLDDRFKGRWLVARGFSLLAQIDRADPLPAYLMAIVDGNDEAAGVLVDRRRRSFPAFRAVAAYRTLALSTRRARSALPGGEEIMAGSPDQLGAIARFLQTEGARRQFCSVWTADALSRLDRLGLRTEDLRIARRRGAIVGVVGLWDQSAYKQAVVHGYSGWLRALRPILPRVGDPVRSAYASLVCLANDDPTLFARLLREIYILARARRFDYLLVGLDARDPLLGVARGYRHWSYASQLYLGSWRNGEALHERLDDRPAYVDVATL